MGWKDSVNVHTYLKFLFYKSLSRTWNEPHFEMIWTIVDLKFTVYIQCIKAIQLQIYARVVRKDASHCYIASELCCCLISKIFMWQECTLQKSCDKLPYHCCFAQWTHLHMHVIRRSLLQSTQVVDRDLFNKYFG